MGNLEAGEKKKKKETSLSVKISILLLFCTRNILRFVRRSRRKSALQLKNRLETFLLWFIALNERR